VKNTFPQFNAKRADIPTFRSTVALSPGSVESIPRTRDCKTENEAVSWLDSTGRNGYIEQWRDKAWHPVASIKNGQVMPFKSTMAPEEMTA